MPVREASMLHAASHSQSKIAKANRWVRTTQTSTATAAIPAAATLITEARSNALDSGSAEKCHAGPNGCPSHTGANRANGSRQRPITIQVKRRF